MRKVINYIVKNKDIYIGLEDSKKTWKLSIRCDQLEIRSTSMPASYPVLKTFLLNKFPGCRIHLIYEAGFKGFNLYDKLKGDGFHCVVIPPHLVTEPKVNKVKTDKRDARRLAKILENGDYRECHVPDKEIREDRQISRTLIGVQKNIVAVKNRIRKLLVFHGIEVKRPNRNWDDKSFLDLKKLDLGPSLKIALEVLIKQLESLLGLRNQLRIELKELCKKKRYVNTFRLIKSIPGIGWFTAIRLVLEFGEDMSRFARANHIASFVGLVSSEYSSGETIRRGRITGQGRSFIRGWLIECAWVAIRKDPALLDKYNRVWRNSGSKKKAIVAVARVLVIRLRSCVLYNNPYIIGVIQ